MGKLFAIVVAGLTALLVIVGIPAFVVISLIMGLWGSSVSSACGIGENGSTTTSYRVEINDDGEILLRGKPLDQEQLEVSSEIIGQGEQRQLSVRDRKMALMTAFTESGARNLRYGHLDSLGVFQQRSGWGTAQQRLHVPYAVSKFYDALEAVTNRDDMSMFDVIVYHVQKPDPAAYRSPENSFMSYEAVAEALLARSSGEVTSTASRSIDYCNGLRSGVVYAGNGVNRLPLDKGYTISSPFGQRLHPILGRWSLHDGVDFSGLPEGSPVYSVADGEVISAGIAGSYGNYVVVRLVDGTEIGYAHLKFISVNVGDLIPAGTLIGGMGGAQGDPGAGTSTGVHLHFNVKLPNGEWTEPLSWLESLGLNP